MKRPYSETFESIPIDDIRKDIPPEQLAAMGAVTLSFNYAENSINRMLLFTVGMPVSLHRDIISRINGIDGKIAIVKKGANELGLSDAIRLFLAETLGEGGFSLFKKYRDAVIHARIFNKEESIGELVESKGKHIEVLLSKAALDGLYTHLEAIRRELSTLLVLLSEASYLKQEGLNDQEKAQHEAKIQEYFVRARSHRTQRLSLPPIPEFPDEAALRAQENQVEPAAPEPITGWLELGTLGLAEIGRALGKKPSQGEN